MTGRPQQEHNIQKHTVKNKTHSTGKIVLNIKTRILYNVCENRGEQQEDFRAVGLKKFCKVTSLQKIIVAEDI